MLHKVTFIALVVFCFDLRTEGLEQAVSSQTFHRDDVPLSYKFTQIHDVKPATPAKHRHIAPYAENKQKPIQYAPIPQKAENFLNQEEIQLNFEEPKKQDLNKENLEPKVPSGGLSAGNDFLPTKENYLTKYGAYSQGHNIEKIPSYRPLPLVHNTQSNIITNQNKGTIYRTENNEPNYHTLLETNPVNSIITPEQFAITNNFHSNLLNNRQFGQTQQAVIYHDEHIPEIVERHQRQPQHAAYALVPRRFMNVARAYGIAYNTNKAPPNLLTKKNFNPEENVKNLNTQIVKKHYVIM